ncbi:MAG: IS4 family transposase [Phycisphaerae bacterium]
MARTPQPKPQEAELHALSIVRDALPLIRRYDLATHPVHGNVQLHLTDTLAVLLAAFFHPTVRSLRLLECLSQMPWAQTQLTVDRVCRSTLSDAFARFDPEQLQPLIKGLMDQIPNLPRRDGPLASLCQQIMAVDGSYFTLTGEVAWALTRTKRDQNKHSLCCLNLQLEIDSFTPAALTVGGPDDGSEAEAVLKHLAPGVIYLMDRNYHHCQLLRTILEHQSDFVLRLRSHALFTGLQDLPLNAEAVAAGVQSDRIGILPVNRNSRTGPPPHVPLRELFITDPQTGKTIRLLTSLMDLPAHLVGHLYRQRWQVELFFRWLKVWGGMQHLLSNDKRGVTLQFYVAVIACLLMHIRTGRKVNKYMIMLMGQVATGAVSFDQITPILERIEREKALARARLARKKAAKNQL